MTRLEEYVKIGIDKSNQTISMLQSLLSKEQASLAYQKYAATIGESVIHKNLDQSNEFENTCNKYNELVQASTKSYEDRFQTIESTNN